MKTIFVMSPNKQTFEKWINSYGFKLSNVEISYVTSKEDTRGHPEKESFFTIVGELDSKESTRKFFDYMQRRFRYIPKESLEGALKGKSRVKVKS